MFIVILSKLDLIKLHFLRVYAPAAYTILWEQIWSSINIAIVTRVSSELREEGFQSSICVYKLAMTVIFPRTMPS